MFFLRFPKMQAWNMQALHLRRDEGGHLRKFYCEEDMANDSYLCDLPPLRLYHLSICMGLYGCVCVYIHIYITVHIIYVYECVNTYLPPSVSICFNFNPHVQLMKMKISIISISTPSTEGSVTSGSFCAAATSSIFETKPRRLTSHRCGYQSAW